MSDPARAVVGLREVRARIARACERAGREPSSVRLIAVSKRHTPEAMRAAYAEGQREFGENYVQELVQKAEALRDLPELRMHAIGRLQRNKVKDLLRVADRLHSVDSVDSLRLAESLAERAAEAGRVLSLLVQVNVAGEAQKGGVREAELPALVAAIRGWPGVTLDGLMVIPPDVEPEGRRPHFRRLRELAQQHGLRELSMGMSDDLETAIEEGATQVRIGTAIFGERD
ncbi:MAG TPA: YggS family pyridoxal phosphate-dependent enzyme [Polyangiales bacterium]|nr:YggS family pyridoxal phosphate-dependent enzyme [Polyangiales bacterium]